VIVIYLVSNREYFNYCNYWDLCPSSYWDKGPSSSRICPSSCGVLSQFPDKNLAKRHVAKGRPNDDK